MKDRPSMSSSRHGTILKSIHYTEQLQQLFADLSGDYNPMHVDAVAARRLMAGERVVHGIHQAFASLEAVLGWRGEGNPPGRAITHFKAEFLKPVVVGDTVDLYLAETGEEGCRITSRIGEQAVSRVTVKFGAADRPADAELPPLAAVPLVELSFADLTNQAGSLVLGLDAPLAHRLFPLTAAALGTPGVAEILALSRLVGMHCPGLHSIFDQADMTLSDQGTTEPGLLHYRVEQTDERLGSIAMAVDGHRWQGRLRVFFRPPPVQQLNMAAVAGVVQAGSFAASTALIIGGSRGLGEVTARIIAAGGGFPMITYFQGRTDAEKVVEDIRSQGGRCEMMQLDVENCGELIQQLHAGQSAPKSLYYFATPKIFGRRHGLFDHDRLDQFNRIYVTAFGRLLDALMAACPGKLRVFFPSSVAVTEGLGSMVEYAMAKTLAEEMCAFYNRQSKKVEIRVERLPRTQTDQTNSLLAVPAADGLEVMFPIVRRMETFSFE